MGDKRLIDNEWITIDECYEKHKRFITVLTRKYASQGNKLGMTSEDIRGFVYIGFVKSFLEFDQELGNKFITLVNVHAFGEVSKGLRNYGKNVHFSRPVKESASKIAKNELENESPKRIAEVLNISYQEATTALQYLRYDSLSFDTTITDGEGESSLHELHGEYQDDFPIYWNDFCEGLSEREQEVLTLKMQDMSQKEIGAVMGFTQVVTSRTLRAIHKKYKQYLEGESA